MRRIRVRLGAAGAALLLAGCGGGSGATGSVDADEGADEATSSAAAEPAGDDEATTPDAEEGPPDIEPAAFCGEVGGDLVATALGRKSQWLVQRKPGQKYDGIGGTKLTSTSFSCRWQTNRANQPYGPRDATFAVQVEGSPHNTEAARQRIKISKDTAEGVDGTTCEEFDLDFGQPSYARSCQFEPGGNSYGDPSGSATVHGLFGEAYVSCHVSYPGSESSDRARSMLEEVCVQMPEILAGS